MQEPDAPRTNRKGYAIAAMGRRSKRSSNEVGLDAVRVGSGVAYDLKVFSFIRDYREFTCYLESCIELLVGFVSSFRVHQGSVLSPFLWTTTMFVNDVSIILPPEGHHLLYADDIKMFLPVTSMALTVWSFRILLVSSVHGVIASFQNYKCSDINVLVDVFIYPLS